MKRQDCIHNIQPKAAAASHAVPGGINPVKGLKQPGNIRIRDMDASVFQGEHSMSGFRPEPDMDEAPGRGVGGSIAQQVIQSLCQQQAVAVYENARFQLFFYVQLLLDKEILQGKEPFLHQLIQGNGSQIPGASD